MTPVGRLWAMRCAAVLATGLSASGCSLSSGLALDGLKGVFEPVAVLPAGAAKALAAEIAGAASPAPSQTIPAERQVVVVLPVAVSPLAEPQGERKQGEQILGESSAEVLRLLGKPALRRVEPPGEMWQYVAGACVVHLFLYRGERGDEHRVQHVEAATRGLVPADVATCLGEVRLRRAAEAAKS